MTSREGCFPCPPGTISTSDCTPIESFLRVTHLLFSEGHAALFLHSICVIPFSVAAPQRLSNRSCEISYKLSTRQVSSASLLDRVLCLDRVQLDTFVSQEPCPPHPWMEGQVVNALKDTTVPLGPHPLSLVHQVAIATAARTLSCLTVCPARQVSAPLLETSGFL